MRCYNGGMYYINVLYYNIAMNAESINGNEFVICLYIGFISKNY